jgi:hypothetical protein
MQLSRGRGGSCLLGGLAAHALWLIVLHGAAHAGPGAAWRGRMALEDSLGVADSLAVADSVAAALADTLGLADTLAVADSLVRADSLARAHLLAPLPTLGSRGPDHRRLRLELGASTDITNERFFEDETDSTFHVTGRRAITTPEARVAGVLFAGLEGTRAQRATHYELDNQLSLGDKVQRVGSWAYWREALTPRWMLVLTPRLEASHDRTFDRDLSEWRAGATSRLRRALGDAGTDAELGVGGDLVRASGPGSEFVIDRNAATGSLAIEHSDLWDDWRAGLALTARSYPDSAERNHREQGVEARWRHSFEAGHWLALDGSAVRRHTLHEAPTTRDDLAEGRLALEGEARADLTWSLIGRLEGEALRYDDPDSTLYFDQTLVRAWLAPRYAADPLVSLAAGPRAEWLVSPLDPAEAYAELGAAIEFESFGRGAWWHVVPAVGRRSYRHEAQRGRFDPVGLHTDYDFIGLDVLADQGLGAGLRLRLLVSGRLERHTDSGDDSRSLYFSLDLRRLLSPGPSGAAVATNAARLARPGF